MTSLAIIQLKILTPLKSGIYFLHDQLSRYTHKLDEKVNGKNLTQEALDKITNNLEIFLSGPNQLADTLIGQNLKYKETTLTYFILKQVSAIYEAESKLLPIQVFNEMRNAFDHFIRSLIHPEDANKEQENIQQMCRHIQRAFLDTSKLLCAFYDKSTKDRHAKFSNEVIGSVTDGDYLKEFTRLQVEAHKQFTEAKLKDYQLGTDGEISVRDAYLNAVIAHKALHKYQANNYHKLKWGAAKIKLSKGLKWSAAIFSSLIAGIILEHLDKIPQGFSKFILNLFHF